MDEIGLARRLTIENSTGQVGIGTAAPTARLHVAGTPGVDGIRYPDGSLQTSAPTRTEEALRMMRGTVLSTGNLFRGAGFTSQRIGLGLYEVTFEQPFVSEVPTVVATGINELGSPVVAAVTSVSLGSFTVEMRYALDTGHVDASFHFIAMGLRD